MRKLLKLKIDVVQKRKLINYYINLHFYVSIIFSLQVCNKVMFFYVSVKCKVSWTTMLVPKAKNGF